MEQHWQAVMSLLLQLIHGILSTPSLGLTVRMCCLYLVVLSVAGRSPETEELIGHLDPSRCLPSSLLSVTHG